MAAVAEEEELFVLTDLPPSPLQKRIALAVVLGIFVVYFIVTGPLSTVHLSRVDVFVPIFLTAVFVSDSITAVVLFAQFSILRSSAILFIASGYLFTALLLIPYLLTFPGVFLPGEGLIGGPQSTAWLYVAWHCVFPAFVLGYAISKDRESKQHGSVWRAIALCIALTAGLVLAVAIACILDEAFLPPIMADTIHFGPMWPYFVGAPVALMCISALIALWMRRRSILDLWLMVVLCLYLVEVPLSYYPVPERFSVGWYSVRVIAILSSSLVLFVLLYEITTLYSRLLGAVRGQRREREARLITGDVVAASIAHEVKQPLSGMITNADAGLRFLNRSTPELDEAREAFQQIVIAGHRAAAVVTGVRAIFRNENRRRTLLDFNELIRETLTFVREDLNRNRIVVLAELNGSLSKVTGDRVQLQQVLVNLMTNAIDSMAAVDGSRILSVKSGMVDGGYVGASIADTGEGINPREIDQIFSSMFTTKADGMGMGLLICRSIIESHDGRLWVAPNAPRGAIFHVSVPSTSDGVLS